MYIKVKAKSVVQPHDKLSEFNPVSDLILNSDSISAIKKDDEHIDNYRV